MSLSSAASSAASSELSSAAAMLHGIVKAYDVRGVVGEQLTVEMVRALGGAFAEFVAPTSRAVVIGHDMRASSPQLAAALADGITRAGLDVVDIGLASTDLLYYASGTLDLPGAMFTASHNPARYNGIKFCLAGAVPLSLQTGLARIRDGAMATLGGGAPDRPAATAPDHRPDRPAAAGAVTARDLLPDYARHLRTLVDLSDIRPLRVAVDAGNGMAGLTVPAVFQGLPIELAPLYFELDGTFPNHEANPLDPANLVDLQQHVRRVGADIGLAFDGDADRCFVVDERGEPVSPSAVTALVALRALERQPGATVLYNLITSRAVPELVTAAGGVAVRTKVGHSYIKADMAATGAVFGGEHSGHYYFADFFRADTGMLAALHVLAALGGQSGPLSDLVATYQRYAASGEINSVVADATAAQDRIRAWAAGHGAAIDELDGVTVTFADGSWGNVRASNTEPLLRLNVEAADRSSMCELRDAMLALIRRDATT